jgi:hypothetical protein
VERRCINTYTLVATNIAQIGIAALAASSQVRATSNLPSFRSIPAMPDHATRRPPNARSDSVISTSDTFLTLQAKWPCNVVGSVLRRSDCKSSRTSAATLQWRMRASVALQQSDSRSRLTGASVVRRTIASLLAHLSGQCGRTEGMTYLVGILESANLGPSPVCCLGRNNTSEVSSSFFVPGAGWALLSRLHWIAGLARSRFPLVSLRFP